MKPNYQEIICILDRSGSMHSIRDDAIGGFNAFVADQRDHPQPARVTLELFDDRFERIYEAMPIERVIALDGTVYVPRGSTALLDAIGLSLANAYIRINNTLESERPDSVVVAVLTDGLENSSREFDYRAISEIIRRRRDENGWQFVFLAANQDAIATASKMALDRCDASNYVSTGEGTIHAFRIMSGMVSERRRPSQ